MDNNNRSQQNLKYEHHKITNRSPCTNYFFFSLSDKRSGTNSDL